MQTILFYLLCLLLINSSLPIETPEEYSSKNHFLIHFDGDFTAEERAVITQAVEEVERDAAPVPEHAGAAWVVTVPATKVRRFFSASRFGHARVLTAPRAEALAERIREAGTPL